MPSPVSSIVNIDPTSSEAIFQLALLERLSISSDHSKLFRIPQRCCTGILGIFEKLGLRDLVLDQAVENYLKLLSHRTLDSYKQVKGTEEEEPGEDGITAVITARDMRAHRDPR